MEDVERKGEVAGDSQQSALYIQVALSIPHDSHDETKGGNSSKCLRNDIGDVITVGNRYNCISGNPGEKGTHAKNQCSPSVFLNGLQQFRNRPGDVSCKEEGKV